jgi:hypothetical protein
MDQSDVYKQLEQLAALKEKGILTEDEFNAQKAALLKSASSEHAKSASSLTVIDDSTFKSAVPYSRLFDLAKESATSVGGRLQAENLNNGSLQFKFKYGINPSGIRVDIQFRRSTDGSTETVVKGRIGDAFDTMGAAKAQASKVLNDIVRRLEAGVELDPPTPHSMATPVASETMFAPVVGVSGVSHRGKSKTTAALLALLVGGIGAHRFYLGTWGWGIFYIVLLLAGLAIGLSYIAAIFGVCEGVRFFIMKPANFDAKYNYTAVGPFTF